MRSSKNAVDRRLIGRNVGQNKMMTATTGSAGHQEHFAKRQKSQDVFGSIQKTAASCLACTRPANAEVRKIIPKFVNRCPIPRSRSQSRNRPIVTERVGHLSEWRSSGTHAHVGRQRMQNKSNKRQGAHRLPPERPNRRPLLAESQQAATGSDDVQLTIKTT